MRYIRYGFLAGLAICLVTLALANRATVTLSSLPDGLAMIPGLGAFAFSVNVPLFVAIFAGIAIGLLIGFVWEWLREHKIRAEAAERGGQLRKLEDELQKTRNERDSGKDEVLAILDQSS